MNDFVNRQDLLDGIEELKQSPWFKNGEDKQDIQHYGYLERKEAVEVVTDLCIKKEPSAWIPVKFRNLTEEEKKLYKERGIFEGAETAWDCPLPDDRQDVLITTTYGDVVVSTFRIDEYDGMYFEEEDSEYVKAWMPLPEPYKTESEAKT